MRRFPKRKIYRIAREFMLIVTGVLTALALGNWNSSRQERLTEREYLAALVQDLRAQQTHFDGWRDALAQHRAWTDTIWEWARGTPPVQPPEQVVLWVRLGGQVNLNTHFPDGAYQDLLNSGSLAVLRNRKLRQALVDYHNQLARSVDLISLNGDRATQLYMHVPAEVIAPEIAWRASSGGPLTATDVQAVMTAFRAQPTVLQGLVAIRQSFDFRSAIAEALGKRAAEMADVTEETSLTSRF